MSTRIHHVLVFAQRYTMICQGCGRTLNEVSNWVFFSQEEKDLVWKRIRADGTAMRFQRQAKDSKTA